MQYLGIDATCTLISIDGMIGTIALFEALDDPRWEEAIHRELAALVKNGTWTLVPLPSGKKALLAKWVLKIKSDNSGYKGRLVFKGYQQ